MVNSYDISSGCNALIFRVKNSRRITALDDVYYADNEDCGASQ
jgi:hypothetical protein